MKSFSRCAILRRLRWKFSDQMLNFFKATKEITHDFYARQKVLLRTGQGDILKADTRDSENTRMKVTHRGDSVGLLTHTNTHTHTEN